MHVFDGEGICGSLGNCGVKRSVLQCVAVYGSVLHVFRCATACCQTRMGYCGAEQVCVAVCCIVLQCVAVRCNVLQCVEVCCSMLQCSTVCCSVL